MPALSAMPPPDCTGRACWWTFSDFTGRLSALEKERPDDDALAARCAALLLPKIKPIIVEITELAVDQAISASFGAVGKLLKTRLDRSVLSRLRCRLL